jgi:hypothetical protein
VPPVVMAKHYGTAAPNADGQIRTNQFMSGSNPQTWMLRQFHIVQDSSGTKIVPMPVATNPPASLFDETINQPLGASFRTDFLNQIAPLSNPDIHIISSTMEKASKEDPAARLARWNTHRPLPTRPISRLRSRQNWVPAPRSLPITSSREPRPRPARAATT